MNLKGTRALVVGLGKSGLAAVRFLAGRGAVVTAADRRPRESMAPAAAALADLPVRLHFGGHPESLLSGLDLVVPSPGVPWDLPFLERARENGVRVCGELEIAAGLLRGRVIGVTGTNGKTTTTTLIDHVLRTACVRGRLAGNVGTPVLDIVDDSRPGDWHAIELSSFQLEATDSFRCHVAAVLNVTPDHLDRHRSIEAYVEAKSRILRNQERRDAAVLNAGDAACQAMAILARGRVFRFGTGGGAQAEARAADGRMRFRDVDVAVADVPIPGEHNVENALAAIAACRLAGVEPASIERAVRTFRPVPHRMEFVASVGGVDYFNDSKATNVAAAVKACGSFRSGLWAILGGRDKGSDFAPLASALRSRACAALLVGEAAGLIRREIGESVPTVESGTIGAALDYAAERARPGDTVLLAPACASFDQYQDYIERGREFRRLVGELGV